MGAFDCPKCTMVRHIDEGENLRDDKCWFCGTRVYSEAQARELEEAACEGDDDDA